jgi:hypothetical protein
MMHAGIVTLILNKEHYTPLLGRYVVINGLVSKSELNGRTGTSLIFDYDKGRYSVELDGTSSFMIKPYNLFLAEEHKDTERPQLLEEEKKNLGDQSRVSGACLERERGLPLFSCHETTQFDYDSVTTWWDTTITEFKKSEEKK